MTWRETIEQYLREGRTVSGGKGATAEEKSTAADTKSFMSTLMGNYSTQFAGQQSILNSIKSGWTPIFQAGPNQYGFSAAEDSALRTQASEGTAGAYRMAKQAAGENLAAVGGGNTFLPSATKAGIMSSIATKAAGQEAGQQLGITTAGYETGRENFEHASAALTGDAALYNPTSYANQANDAGKTAFDDYNTIQQQEAAASPWGAIGGAVGGIAGSFIPGIGTALGSSLGSALGKGVGG
jgi:hypothetical protein